MTSEDHSQAFSAVHDDELSDYRSLCVSAIVGFIVSLLSPLAMARTMLVLLPVVALFICSLAVIRIHRAQGRLLGKRIALTGLCIASVFVVAAPARAITRESMLQQRATPIAMAWFDALISGAPHQAAQLLKPELARRPLGDGLWEFYRNDPNAQRELEQFVNDPAVRFLLSVGKDADVRLFETAPSTSPSPNSDLVAQIFAVTFPNDKDERETFFMTAQMERRFASQQNRAHWRVVDVFPTKSRSGL